MEASPASLFMLDACSLLNLIASRRFAQIARNSEAQFAIAEPAAAEVRFVRCGGTGPDALEREAVNLADLELSGLLVIHRLETSEERAAFVAFAREVDDGEAACCALTIHRGGILVTDDRKARRVLAQRSPPTSLLTTSEVIKSWADRVELARQDLARVLLDVEERGSFRPGRHDPLASWWETMRRRD